MIFFVFWINQLYIHDLMISIRPEINDLQLVILSEKRLTCLSLFGMTVCNVYFSIRIFLSLPRSIARFSLSPSPPFLFFSARGNREKEENQKKIT